MPFYEYQCSSCGHTLEAMQKITEAPLKKCPHCGKPQLQKLMSAPVFRLKGGGWYETDFKSDQDNKRNLADRPDSDAPKDDKKDKAEASGKETPAATDAAKPEKSADKPSEKAAGSGAKAADSGTKAVPAPAAGASASPSRRTTGSTANKAALRKPVKRPARPAAKRTAAKPARRR
jgi:putative FmdB family regulatory protein